MSLLVALRCLDLSNCDWGDGGGGLLCGLKGAHLPRLAEINLTMDIEHEEAFDGVNNASVCHLAREFPGLQSLDVTGNHGVGDLSLKRLAQLSSGLITLGLQGTSVSSKALVRWLPKLPRLRRLAIGGLCNGLEISPAQLMALVTGCSQLDALDYEEDVGYQEDRIAYGGLWVDEAAQSFMAERRRARACAGDIALPPFAWSDEAANHC